MHSVDGQVGRAAVIGAVWGMGPGQVEMVLVFTGPFSKTQEGSKTCIPDQLPRLPPSYITPYLKCNSLNKDSR